MAAAITFQSRCRDWVVGEGRSRGPRRLWRRCFSLVAEIGWLASQGREGNSDVRKVSVSLPRLGGWRAALGLWPLSPVESFSLVAEIGWLASLLCPCGAPAGPRFQSRCRDWVVGEWISISAGSCLGIVSVSLPRLGGWRVGEVGIIAVINPGFSLVAEIGWLASGSKSTPQCFANAPFQSRCRDWVVGENIDGLHPFAALLVSVSLPRLGGWRGAFFCFVPLHCLVSVSLPRLGGWRDRALTGGFR